MDVSIIIVNYNTCAMTLGCIESIFKWTSGLAFEVIVVDNASKDESVPVLGSDNRIIFIEAEENLGFGRANNLALKSARGEYILLLNSDTYLIGNAVYNMWKFMKTSDLNIGALGTILLDRDGNVTHSSAFFPDPWRVVSTFMKQFYAHLSGKRFTYRMPEISYMDIPDNRCLEVDYITGADLMSRRDTFEKFGAFDPDFFLYYEETEMQHRWHRAGLKNYVIPLRGIVHLGGATTGPVNSIKRKKILIESERLYFRKTMSPILGSVYAFFHRIVYLPASFKKKECRNDHILAIDCRPFTSKVTGIANVLRLVVDAMVKQYPEIRIILFSPVSFDPSLNRDYRKNANIVVVRCKFLSEHFPSLLWYNIYLPLLLKRYEVTDFLSVRTELPLWLPREIRKTVFVHDVVALEFPETMEIKNRVVSKLFFSRAIRKADLLWCVSDYTKAKVIQYFPEAASKIAIVGIGSDMDLFRNLNLSAESKNAYLKSLGVTGRPLLFVGSIEPRKNLSFLLNLMPELSRRGFQLIVVGAKGWKNSDIADIVNAACFPKNSVLFCGYVSDEELVKLYNCVECYVSTSLNEGFGLPQLEAMLCGCRVVSPDNSAMSEVVGGRGELIASWNKKEWIERIVSYCNRPLSQVDLSSFLWNNPIDSFVSVLYGNDMHQCQ